MTSAPKSSAARKATAMVQSTVANFSRRSDRAAQEQLSAAVLEFQRPSSAIVNAPVPLFARGTVWAVASMLGVSITAMALIPVDRVVATRGIVVSNSPTILVQPLDTSIVRSIDVREGDKVVAGQLLARLDPTFATADLGAISAQLASIDVEIARLRAESEGREFDPSGLKADGELQATIFRHRQAEFRAKIETYQHKIGELNAVRERSVLDTAAYRTRLAVADEIEKMRRDLEARQVGARINTLSAIDVRAEIGRALANAEKTVEGVQKDIAAIESERRGYIQAWSADVSQKLSEATRRQNDLREQLNKARLRKELVELRAEKDGIVQSLAKVSVGSVLQSGQPFVTLVPIDGRLEIEANVRARENGFVKIGDEVAVKFDTLPFAQYGMARGVVTTVSPDAFTAQSEARNPTGAAPLASEQEPYYRARITISEVALRDTPASFRMIPGMPVTADIKVGKRTVLSYLLNRVVPVAKEGMREP